MQGIKHPLTGDVYELLENDRISVTADDGRSGIFDIEGRYISGDLKFADAHVCGWMAHTPGASSVAPLAT